MANNYLRVIICRAKIGFFMENVKWKMENVLFNYFRNDKFNLLFSMMIYFKKIQLIDPGKEETELALRKVAIKSKSPLNKGSSRTDAGTKKLFFGFDGPDDTTFTRVRYFIEGYMPKIIISISKDNDDNQLKFKLDFVSTCIFLGASFLFMSDLIAELSHQEWENAAYVVLFYSIFIGLIWLEIRLTQRNIDRAIRRLDENKL
jgi:hypothetical protein